MVSQTLLVWMNGYPVGQLQKTGTGAHHFQYDSEWLKLPGARPISLSLPLQHKVHTGDAVYHYFDNLLPEHPRVRARIQARFQSVSTQPFDLLASIGKDCVGAVQLLPIGETPAPLKEIQARPLNEDQLLNLLKSYQQEIPLGMVSDDFRISLAGVQEKTALLKREGQWWVPLGATPTTHILKLPIGRVSHQIDLSTSVENEYLCLHLAGAFGLPVPRCEIVDVAGFRVLAVERFDRQLAQDKSWIMRRPQEDYCQVFNVPAGRKYESDGGPGVPEILHHLLGSDTANQDRHHLMKAQVLFWLLAATDGHAKNVSVFIHAQGRYSLTPFYDILSAYPTVGTQGLYKGKLKLAMALKGSRKKKYKVSHIYPRHFLQSAQAWGFDPQEMQAILNHFAQQTPGVIEQVQNALPPGFPESVSEPILTGLADMARRLDCD